MATKKQETTPAEKAPRQITQDGDHDMLVMIGELGQTRVSEDVVGKIAGLAVREIEGVHALVPFGAGQAISSIAKSLGASGRRDIGVHVEVGQVEAAVDVRIVTEYGAAIPRVADNIRENVSRRIEAMTGLKVTEINIDVVDLFFEEDKQRVEEQADPRVR